MLGKLKMSQHGSNRTTLNKAIEDFNIDLTKINQNRSDKVIGSLNESRRTIPLDDLISGKHQKDYQGNRYAERLIKAGYKEHKCEKCGLTEWLGKPIPLQLHHKNGDHCDNKLENVELLCPNCHVMTDTYGGKNVKYNKKIKKEDVNKKTKKGISEDGKRYYDGYGNYKILCPECHENFMNKEAKMCKSCRSKERLIPKIPKDELYKAIDSTNNYNEVARKYGCDRDTIIKWHKYYALEDKKNGVYVIASENVPSREVLKEEIRTKSFNEVGKIHGNVNGNTVKKWCVRYCLPHLREEINNMSDEDWALV